MTSRSSHVVLHVNTKDIFAFDEDGVEHAQPPQIESEFTSALLTLADKPSSDSDAESSPEAVARAKELHWKGVYDALARARDALAHGGAVLDALSARRWLTAERQPSSMVKEVSLKGALASKRAQLGHSARLLLARSSTLAAQLKADQRHFRQLRRLASRWHVRKAPGGGLFVVFAEGEHAACVRVHDGHVSLRLPPHRALALGKRIAVWHGERRVATILGPAPAPRPTDESFGVAHCDTMLRRARQSFWLEQLFRQLRMEASKLSSDIAFLSDDWLSEQRVVCIMLDLGDAGPPLSLAFQLEPVPDEDEDAVPSRKRGREEGQVSARDAALMTMVEQLDQVLSRLCLGVVERAREQELDLLYDAPPMPGFERDARIDGWFDEDKDRASVAAVAEEEDGDDMFEATESADFPVLGAFFKKGMPLDETMPVSFVEATRLLFAQCLAVETARRVLHTLKEAMDGALESKWSAPPTPFEQSCHVSLAGTPLGELRLVDGKVRRALVNAAPPAHVPLGVKEALQFGLRQHARTVTDWVANGNKGGMTLDSLCSALNE